jgi:hypothetical protein
MEKCTRKEEVMEQIHRGQILKKEETNKDARVL